MHRDYIISFISQVYRRMLGILNRVTEQSLTILLEQAQELPLSDPDHLPHVLALLLDKVCSRSHAVLIYRYAYVGYLLLFVIDKFSDVLNLYILFSCSFSCFSSTASSSSLLSASSSSWIFSPLWHYFPYYLHSPPTILVILFPFLFLIPLLFPLIS